ncbi:hypothetical protein PPERSA_00033 [Pseudocohnilembus persalinus]|uniref:Uncharacterized protein n=1 Tax=Pseudocohnilembus persalinus TaxID=266149 RepID=A0A0V0Q850_PSEPJ|nr:hypothetical protein PPERSA_00033 [Pseudocohnilembus persalinus]|eukprot:KRW98374.1 hypothetical protein PPERSA_00033 [Pseudocohnilembus persalinus]
MYLKPTITLLIIFHLLIHLISSRSPGEVGECLNERLPTPSTLSEGDDLTYGFALIQEPDCQSLIQFDSSNSDITTDLTLWEAYAKEYAKCHYALSQNNQLSQEQKSEVLILAQCFDDDYDYQSQNQDQDQDDNDQDLDQDFDDEGEQILEEGEQILEEGEQIQEEGEQILEEGEQILDEGESVLEDDLEGDNGSVDSFGLINIFSQNFLGLLFGLCCILNY